MQKKDFGLKVFSLGVGIAISFVLIAKVCFESSYDNFYQDIERIYQIKSFYTQRGDELDYERCSGGVAPGFKQYVPGVACATRTTGFFTSDKYFLEDKSVITGRFVFADSCFFQVFDRPILAGQPEKVLSEPGHVMVSRSFAEKIAPLEQVIGKQFCNEEMPQLIMTIGGVFEDFPANGSLDYDVMLSLNNMVKESTENWLGNDRYTGYVKLQEGIDPTTLKAAIRLMQEKNQPLEGMEKQGISIRYYLSPLNMMHTSDPLVRNLIWILSVVSVILLAVSLMNYSLISISEMVKRTKEIGIHKCYGAGTADIYRLLAKETAVTLLCALLLAALLVGAAQPLIEELLDVKLQALFIPETYGVLTGILLLLFVLSVWIPGLLYTHVPVSTVFRNYRINKRHWKLILLTFQFIINVFLLGFLIVIAVQYHKVLNTDPGYNYDHLYYVQVRGISPEDQARCVAQLRALSDIEQVECAYHVPFDGASGNNILLPGDTRGELFNVADQYDVTKGFLQMMEIPVVEGRLAQTEREVMVSRSFVEKMKQFADWKDGAIGKEVQITGHSYGEHPNFTIAGIYPDYSLGGTIVYDTRPSILFVSEKGFMPYILIKLKQENPKSLDKVKNLVANCIEGRPLELYSYQEQLSNVYGDYKKIRNTIFVGVIFSIVIAFMGLIGYIREEALRRSKEIAIRKVNGATQTEIIGMFIKDVMKLLALAIIIGDAAAYYVSGYFMEQFPIQSDLSIWYFLCADLIIILLVLVVVILNCLKIADANPVCSLKNE